MRGGSNEPQNIILIPMEFVPSSSKGATLTFQSSASAAVVGTSTTTTEGKAVAPKPARGDDASAASEIPAGVPLLQLYASFLGCCAVAWLLYLLLPRACKDSYFGNTKQGKNRKKSKSKNYANHLVPQASADDNDDWYTFEPVKLSPTRRLGEQPSVTSATAPGAGAANSVFGAQSNFTTGTGSISVQDSILAATEARRRRDVQREQSDQNSALWEDVPMQYDADNYRDRNIAAAGMLPMGMAYSDADLENHQTPAKDGGHRYFSNIPSPDHPQIKPLPADAVWRECYRRLQGTGMRLTAHGVQCPSKRIWLQYVGEETTLFWQTEFPRQVPSTAARASTVWVRGARHRIPAGNVLYIDVGKKTTALLQTPATVLPSTCFSLLTQAGSLDLQANSKLERDAVVSALSYILDIVHQGSDWRRLYDESSTIIGGGGASDRAPSSVVPPSESNFYNPSEAAVSNIASDLFPPGPNEI